MRLWWFIALTLTALTLGLAFAHVLELGPKLGYDPALYLTLHRTLYWGFGTIGGAIDVGAVLASVVLAYSVRRRPAAFRWAMLGAAALISAHLAWWLWVNPANIAMMQLPLDNPRPGWQLLRDQWEYTHLARFFVQLAAFIFQLTSVLVEITPHSERG